MQSRRLFDAIRLGNLTLNNRLIRSATWENLADAAGHVTPALLAVYEELAQGGVGLIIGSVAYITRTAPHLGGRLGLYDESCLPGLQQLTAAVHRHGCPVLAQLAYVGSDGEGQAPASLTLAELQALPALFAASARLAQTAGFDGVQIHAAHGFLLSQFLHPEKNTRRDAYGGSREQRGRLLQEIYQAIRTAVGPDFAVFLKIDASAVRQGAEVLATAEYISRTLAAAGLTAVEVSGEHSVMQPSAAFDWPESVYRREAAQLAASLSVPVILVGLNRTPAVLQELLDATAITAFALSRPLLYEPALPRKWQQMPHVPSHCRSCNHCFQPAGGNRCPFRPIP